jgi:glutathionyl-hydroquinone reductase
LRYLSNKFLPPSNPYYPRNNFALQAEIDSLFTFYYKKIRFVVLPQLLTHFQGVYKFDMNLYDQPKIGTQVEGVLGEIDRILQGKIFLTSSGRITAADVLIFSEVVQLEIIGYGFKEWKCLYGWMGRMYGDEVVWAGHEKLRDRVREGRGESGSERESFVLGI